MKSLLIPGNELPLRQAHSLLKAYLISQGHGERVAHLAAGSIILAGLHEYDALLAAYRRTGALVISKRTASSPGYVRRFVPLEPSVDLSAVESVSYRRIR